MAADLGVSVSGGGPVQIIHAAQHGVFPEFMLDIQHRPLSLFFLLQRRVQHGPPLLEQGIIGKHIQLLRAVRLRLLLGDHPRGHHIHPPYQQLGIHHAVIQRQDGLRHQMRR